MSASEQIYRQVWVARSQSWAPISIPIAQAKIVQPLVKDLVMRAKRNINGQVPPGPANNKFGVHADVLKLGLVSLLTDLSSEMIFSIFAIFFTTIAGALAALLGLVEGFADFSASSLNY